MTVKPWDIYAKQLFPIGYGHPLWVPEPDSISGRGVVIGDVGWLNDGAFRPLFNSMKEVSHIVNQGKSVPRDFRVFRLGGSATLSIGKWNMITQPVVFSGSISAREVQADIAATGPNDLSAGAGWRFKVEDDTGALLMHNPPGVAERIESKLHIVRYMSTHFDSWLELANASDGLGLGLRPEDIVFVCGTLKTTDWALAAFQGTTFRNKEGYISGQLGSAGNVGFSVHISSQRLPANHYRTSPPRPTARLTSSHLSRDSPDDISPDDPDQCLFIHYYKMKRRLLWRMPMQASAGPHELPPGPDNTDQDVTMSEEGSDCMCDFVSEYHVVEDESHVVEDPYDPVSHLLDYILQNSRADTAIASDLDLITLFKDKEFPRDIANAIRQLSPFVQVDRNGVGTIIGIKFDDPLGPWPLLPSKRTDLVCDDELTHAKKRGRYDEDMPEQ